MRTRDAGDAETSGGHRGRLRAMADAGVGAVMGSAQAAVEKSLAMFRSDLRKEFASFGLGKDALNDLVKSLTQPVLDALKSGSDFVAQIFVAGVKHVTAVGANSASQSVEMVFKGIEIEYNHSTGELAIDQTSVSISQTTTISASGETPHLLDATDGTFAALPDMFAQFEAFMRELAEEFMADPADAPPEDQLSTPVDAAVIEATDAAKDDAVADAEAAADESPVPDDAPVEEPASGLRLQIDHIERFANARMQQITRMRFDLLVPIVFEPAGGVSPTAPAEGGVAPSGISISA